MPVLFFFAGVGLLGHISDGASFRFKTPSFVLDGGLALSKIDNGWCFYSVASIPSLDVGDDGLVFL